MPLSGDRKPVALLKTTFDERYPQFSPDGRWIAYQSNESGQDEIYAQPFPGPGEKTQISTNGGAQVRWNRNGKELFYVAPDLRLMAVSVVSSSTAKTLQPAPPTALFASRLWNNATAASAKQDYVVSPNGQRFLMLVDPPDAATAPITVIANWAGSEVVFSADPERIARFQREARTLAASSAVGRNAQFPFRFGVRDPQNSRSTFRILRRRG